MSAIFFSFGAFVFVFCARFSCELCVFLARQNQGSRSLSLWSPTGITRMAPFCSFALVLALLLHGAAAVSGELGPVYDLRVENVAVPAVGLTEPKPRLMWRYPVQEDRFAACQPTRKHAPTYRRTHIHTHTHTHTYTPDPRLCPTP